MGGLGWWFGIRIGVPLSDNPFHRGIPGTKPPTNHWLIQIASSHLNKLFFVVNFFRAFFWFSKEHVSNENEFWVAWDELTLVKYMLSQWLTFKLLRITLGEIKFKLLISGPFGWVSILYTWGLFHTACCLIPLEHFVWSLLTGMLLKVSFHRSDF